MMNSQGYHPLPFGRILFLRTNVSIEMRFLSKSASHRHCKVRVFHVDTFQSGLDF